MRQLVSLLCPAILDGFGDLGVHFLRGDDIIGTVDFRKTLAFDTGGFAGLETWMVSMDKKRTDILSGVPAAAERVIDLRYLRMRISSPWPRWRQSVEQRSGHLYHERQSPFVRRHP